MHMKREIIKHFGRIPAVLHTDHGKIVRMEHLPIGRIDAKHFRWYTEFTSGAWQILYRPGSGPMHRAADALSRNPEHRDLLVLARTSEWNQHRAVIRGIQTAIDDGVMDDEDPPLHQVRPEDEIPPHVRLIPEGVETPCAECQGDGAEAQCELCNKPYCWICLPEHPCMLDLAASRYPDKVSKKGKLGAPSDPSHYGMRDSSKKSSSIPQKQAKHLSSGSPAFHKNLKAEPSHQDQEAERELAEISPCGGCEEYDDECVCSLFRSLLQPTSQEKIRLATDVICQQGSKSDPVKALFLAPFAITSEVERKCSLWRDKMEKALNVRLRMVIGDPPFDIPEDIDGLGYWVKPVAGKEDARRKILRKQIMTSLVLVLGYVVRHRPRILIGVEQGGLIAALCGQPLLLETACRLRIVTTAEMKNIREAWAGVAAIVSCNPLFLPQRSFMDEIHAAVPELKF